MKNSDDHLMINENHQVTRAAGIIGLATLISRFLGYVRDMVLASFFGAGMVADAFIAAFRIPNLLRRLFGEGSLSIAFIPVFTEIMIKGDKADGHRLAVSALKLLIVVLSLITIIGIMAAPLIIKMIAPGFADEPEKMALTIILTRLMFPYLIMIGTVALCMGILNVLGHFAAPALAPVLLNLSMISAVFGVSLFSDSQTVRVLALAGGVLLGGVLQLALQLPFLARHGIRFWKRSGLWHPAMKKVGVMLLPTIFGAAVYQINILVGTLLASLLAEGSVSYLYYADRLVQFPLGIFGQATATAVLPSLSRQAAGNDYTGLADTFGHAMSLVLFITIPAMVGLIVLREPIVALLFQRGAFDEQATRLTSMALLYYVLGLWAFSAVRIVVSVFYALKDTRTPVITATISIATNLALGMVLMGPLKHGGLALATSMASMLNLVLMVCLLRKKMGFIRWRPVLESCLKTIAASLIMATVVLLIRQMSVFQQLLPGGMRLPIMTIIAIGSGIAAFCVAAKWLAIAQWNQVLELVKRRLGRA
jgi:putative peptidoglycan lipid II flippase